MKYDKYIGIPYKDNGRDINGIDCWGLVCLYYREELGIELPSYTEEYNGPTDKNVIRAISAYKDTWELTTTPDQGDVVLFNIYGEPRHIGIYIGNNKFLHSREGRDSVVDSLASPRWASRLEGTYKYTETNSIQVIGAPHPLKTQLIREWTVAGTTVKDFIDYTTQKYSVSPAFESQLIVSVDGKPIPQSEWETTTLQNGQLLAYKSVPQGGKNSMRMIAMFAVIVFAPALMGEYMGVIDASATEFGALTAEQVAMNSAITNSWTYRLGTIAIQMAGMALVNSIFPVRPDQTNNPGSAGQLNLFTGGSNQANRFGAIPVVLGTVRATGMLGATPYLETAPDTNLLNLLIVWGFGPLKIDNICAGATPILDLYKDSISNDVPRPETIYGTSSDTATKTAAFNKLYGSDIEQHSKGLELVNNIATGQADWVQVDFTQEATSVEIALTCPEGMRAINTKNGEVLKATANIQLQLGKYSGNNITWSDIPAYSSGSGNNINPWQVSIPGSILPYGGNEEGILPLYQYTTIGLLPGGSIKAYHGTATDVKGANPSTWLQTQYKQGSYGSLIGSDDAQAAQTFNYLPTIPNGVYKLYTFVTYGRQGIVNPTTDITNYLPSYTAQGLSVTGLGISFTQEYVETIDAETNSTYQTPSGGIVAIIAAGSIISTTATVSNVLTEPVVICTSRSLAALNPTTYPNTGKTDYWCDLLNDYGIWNSNFNNSISPWETTITLNESYFAYTGWYTIEASADDEGLIRIDGKTVVTMPYAGSKYSIKNWVYLEKGSHTLTLRALNSGQNIPNDARSIAFKIIYDPTGLNIPANGFTRIDFGENGFYEKRKDPFNFSYRFYDLEKARYAIRAKRINADTAEITEGDITVHYYHKVIFASATCFDNTNPVVDPPGCKLAKTAIKVQSTNKINGQIDGINALVTTLGKNWNKTTQKWDLEVGINNPASLFLHVLTHPANAYKLSLAEGGVSPTGVGVGTKIDWPKLQEWHEFCETGNPSGSRLTFNTIVTGTQSIMDMLRDICAAGMASPQYADGKWTVVIDKPRSYTSQYFTTYNSWDFSATKNLPKLPHAFRVTIADEEKAFQANELFIYNYGYNADGSNGKLKATLFESLNLPGITNADQATFMARWHLAQLYYRPEVYTLNTDFEYLVCQRGDVVKVTHDVPQWGSGSGRIKNPTVGALTLALTEPIQMIANTGYQILIRTNNKDPSAQGILKNITPKTQTGYYDTIELASAITNADGLAHDNLFMIGITNQVSQQLVVLSIEPVTNTAAKLTLVDYSPAIYTSDLTQMPIFNANITPLSASVIQNTIPEAPVITNITSNSPLSEQIGSISRNVAIISFSNPASLTKNAEVIQVQIIEGTASFGSASLNNLYSINKEQGSLVVNDLVTGAVYKVRARYGNKMGTISGPWSAEVSFTNIGKDTNYYTAPTLTMDLDGTLIKAYPGNTVKPTNFKHYEYRIYKDTGSEDFWELPVVGKTATEAEATLAATYNIFSMTSTNEGVFDISSALNPKPRISTQGVEYRVACRAVDTNDNYSETSTLGAITVKTIQ